MHPNEDDEFEIIDSHYELTDSNSSSHDPLPQKRAIIYQVSIKPTKIEVDLSIMENQYYQLDVKKRGLNYCTVERRFSEFELIYDVRGASKTDSVAERRGIHLSGLPRERHLRVYEVEGGNQQG
jgi:hypothetical protein